MKQRRLRSMIFFALFAGMTTIAAAVSRAAEPSPASGQSEKPLTVHGDPPDPEDVSEELKEVYRHIDESFEAHVSRLQEWVRIPGVSNTVEGQPKLWDGAKYIRDLIVDELGCTAEIHAPGLTDWGWPGNPVVYGRCDVGAEKTIIDYIHGDAMPTWPEEEWPAPPFSARLIEKPPFKKVLVGKASSNQKGKEMAQLNALISIKAVTGTLPVNVIFVVDHDEERADGGLRTFMLEHAELFRDADVAFGYGGAQLPDGRGQITGMSIGLLVFELETYDPQYRYWLKDQPMWHHFQMLERLFGEDSELLQEISQDVVSPSTEETAFLRREAEMGGGDPPFEELMKRRTNVRVTVTGTWGGNMAPGFTGHIVPVKTTSKIDIRYPPEIDGNDIVATVRSHLDRLGYRDVGLTVLGDVPWSWANADNEIGDAIQKMYRQFGVPFNEPPEGNYIGTWFAAGPPYLFTRAPLQIPHGRGGLGYGWGAHFGPEFYVIEGDGEKIYGFAGAMKSAATVLYNYAGK